MYLNDWYERTRQGKTGPETFAFSVLYDTIRPFKAGYALSKRKLGLDLRTAPFPCVREHTRHGTVYTISW